jgi:purine catabolism regulator
VITIRALMEFEELGMRLIAGEGGLHKAVSWAHVSELEDPTPWLDGSELLMTTGIGIPRAAPRQVTYVQRLIDVGVAGVAIGDNMHAPPLSPSMLDLAQAADFPVLLVTREVPFIALAKTVAAANRDAILKRFSTHLRVYETLNQAVRCDADPVGLFRRLAEVTGYELFLLCPSGQPLFAGLPPFSGCAPAAISECLERPTLTPLQIQGETRTVYLVPIIARQRRVGVIAAVADQEREPDRLVLHHIAAVASLVAIELLHERERLRHEGSERLLRFLADPANAAQGLAALFEGATSHDLVTVAAICLDDPTRGWDDLHHSLHDASCRHLLAQRGRLGYVFSLSQLGTEAELGPLLTAAMSGTTIGLSRPLPTSVRGEIALEEACAALRSALVRGVELCSYDPHLGSAVPSLDIAALSNTVETILGKILEYDARAGTALYQTLKLFLEHDRNVKTTSIALSIHRQTLVYRLKRIEEISGRSTSSTADLCDLWTAIRAREALLATPDSRSPALLTDAAA